MNGYNGTVVPPGAMYVRALYDYDADDTTSLSFRQGDIIQVITQLESGWWDGVINGVRGWFPSNYCAVVSQGENAAATPVEEDADTEDDSRDEYEDQEYEEGDSDSNLPILKDDGPGNDDQEQEEAAFWIPQATPDGRLFYFNTLTGVSTVELPLETPSSSTENGPRDRTNVDIPERTRPPPERMAGGYEREDDTDYEASASEAEGMMGSRGSLPRRLRSFTSDGISPSRSTESIGALGRTRGEFGESNTSFSIANGANPPLGTTMTSFSNSPTAPFFSTSMTRRFFDEPSAVPLSWNRLVEDMRRSVERFRQAINNSDRSEFVKRAEDISDHLRLLLAAGSGTTDNHSGNPSIINTNKALYPHFRDTMSRFSKLVLSAHIAACDWPPADSYAKCLKEADGLLHGVYGFVEVARQQRGEEIPRLIPGFVANSRTGGSWQNNGLSSRDPTSTLSFMDQDDDALEPTARLDPTLLERLEDLKRMVVSSIKRLEELLVIHDKIITPARHQALGDSICQAGGQILEVYRPWLSTVESINLSSLGTSFQNPQIMDFSVHKQRVYDAVSDLIISCQSVAAPLGDEWSYQRSDTLESRITTLRTTLRDLENCTSQVYFALQLLQELMPVNGEGRNGSIYDSHTRNASKSSSMIDDAEANLSDVDTAPETIRNGASAKVKQFFGEVPVPAGKVEEVPEYLRLDYDREVAYDSKVEPPQLRGGTLMALVEQLTRHDKLDSPFNNTFLLTYQSFTTANELFELLVKRWQIQPPFGISDADYQKWVNMKQKPIRWRVVNILKSWLDNYWMEGYDEPAKALIHKLYKFAKETVATTNTPGAAPLISAIEQRARGQDPASKRLVLTLNTQTPPPIMPKNMKKLKFLDIDATEFARQLTIIESKLYGKIKPTECLNKTWQKKLVPGEPDPAANVKALILHSNQLTNWVAQMILAQADVKRRVIVIKHFVSVADKCRVLNNFSTLTSIISALGTAPIHRLGRTWHQVNARTMATLESMRKLMNSPKNFAEYRETLHKANPPCIPFFGVYLTDLTFIEDGIPSTIKKTNLINFGKRAKTAEVIRDIQQYQNAPYPLQPVPELQEYILSNMRTAGDVHEMYEMSLSVEPREREDEKIARYVSDRQRMHIYPVAALHTQRSPYITDVIRQTAFRVGIFVIPNDTPAFVVPVFYDTVLAKVPAYARSRSDWPCDSRRCVTCSLSSKMASLSVSGDVAYFPIKGGRIMLCAVPIKSKK